MGIAIGLVGLGQFGSVFADLFHAHPDVDRIALCDLEPERIASMADRFADSPKLAPRDRFASLDDLLETDVDAVAIITQPWLHAPQCIQAMEAGKDVYSAVPLISLPDGQEILSWCERLVDCCIRTGRRYMLGETTWYRPETMFCRRMAREGAFGDFVYAEGEYFHDVDGEPSLRDVHRRRQAGRAGDAWRQALEGYRERGARGGPMFYPTHSVSGPLCVMQTRAVSVSAHGYRNRNADPYFEGDAFSNEVALYRLRNGASLRICECREVAGAFHANETFRIMGTRGSFAEGCWQENHRTSPGSARPLVTNALTTDAMRDPLPDDVALAFARIDVPDASGPGDFRPTGHGGSHPYLVHEFVRAVMEERLPACNAWDAAHYMAMGVAAHESAMRDGELLSVPDFGEPA
jgi:predicted dehydrogenase